MIGAMKNGMMHVRFPPHVKAWIKSEAAANKRSMSDEVLIAVEEKIKRAKKIE